MYYLIIPILLFIILSGLAVYAFRWASTHRDDSERQEAGRRGCLLALANLFLRPVPVILAFYQFGFLAAVAVALSIWLISRCFDLYKGVRLWSGLDPRQVVLPSCALPTLISGDPTYFQLFPSAWCVLHFLEQLDGLIRQRADLFLGDYGRTVFSKDEIRIARWGILGASLIALLISEYARNTFTLSGWLWYYGYLRLELLPVFLGGIAPAMVKMIGRSERDKS